MTERTALMDVVRTGKVPDGPGIRYGELKIDVTKVPEGFRQVASDFRIKGDVRHRMGCFNID